MPASKNDIDQYISAFPKEIQTRLQQVRKTIKAAAPGAEELISYAMPGYKLNGALVYFAGYKNHIGFYPVPSGIKAFEKELAPYKAAKGSAQFPHDEPIPFDLITKIVKFRVEENGKKAQSKKGTKSKTESPDDPFAGLSAPAKRALANSGIKTLEQLSKYSKEQVLQLHGMGPSSLPKLEKALLSHGLSFSKSK